MVIVITAAMVAFVWWRSTKSLKSPHSLDGAQPVIVVSDA
jgi:hypothetical protein